MKSVVKKTIAVCLSVMAFSSLLFYCGKIYSGITQPKEDQEGPSNIKFTVVKSTELHQDYSDMLSSAVKSVVGISARDSTDKSGIEYIGSGVLVGEDGYIITNQHVVGARPGRVEVTLSDGETIDGKTLWSSSGLDIAIVKISGGGYSYSPMGDAETLRVGECVLAIGNPLSLRFERSVTAGIVSALGRNIEIENEKGETYYMEDLIQTDASINPGNSGGPLLNKNGEVVGINTVKVSNAEGMGFAVPVNICVPVIERLRSDGKFIAPYLGLYAYDKTTARYYNKNFDIESGLFVAKLDSEGPAFNAGIRYGDVIVSVNKKSITSMLGLREEVYNYQVGDVINIDYIRNKKTKTAKVTLDKAP